MTNETQKTGVEWYSRRLFEIEIAHNQGVINRDVYLKSKTHAFEEAKEMERERMIELIQFIVSEKELVDYSSVSKETANYYYDKFNRGGK